MKDEKNSFAYRSPPTVSRLSSPDLKLTFQFADGGNEVPPRAKIRRWITAALQTDAEITVRFVGETEARQLNRDYRGQDRPTNVLSFLYDPGPPITGDIALCVPLAQKEAKELAITVDARIAHLLVHATLHLQGYNHKSESDARVMEALETRILAKFGFADPYSENAGDEDMTGHFRSSSILNSQSSIL